MSFTRGAAVSTKYARLMYDEVTNQYYFNALFAEIHSFIKSKMQSKLFVGGILRNKAIIINEQCI